MKILIKRFLQSLLGLETYLFLFARWIIASLRTNKKEGDFLHFISMLRNGDTVIDAGANIGVMTAHLARRLPDSEIIAIEPVPVNIRTLKRVIRHFRLRNVKVIEKALGETGGIVEMVMPCEGKVRLHGLSHVVHESVPLVQDGERYRVPMIRLDALADELNGKVVSGIKIDTENFEYFVLKGSTDIITRFHPVIYAELWDNENRAKCFQWAGEMKYEIRVLKNRHLIPFEPETCKTQNFFFIPA